MKSPSDRTATPAGFHRNAWPASIGTGGRLASESVAGFVGMRSVDDNVGKIPGQFCRLHLIGNFERDPRPPLAPGSRVAGFVTVQEERWRQGLEIRCQVKGGRGLPHSPFMARNSDD